MPQGKGPCQTTGNEGGAGPENYVPHLVEYIGRANGIDLTPKKLKR